MKMPIQPVCELRRALATLPLPLCFDDDVPDSDLAPWWKLHDTVQEVYKRGVSWRRIAALIYEHLPEKEANFTAEAVYDGMRFDGIILE